MHQVIRQEELFFENETRKHQQAVSELLVRFAQKLLTRATCHDESKLSHPERDLFIEYTPKLASVTYGSPEYKDFLKELQVALTHHYENNSHHPEPAGIEAMTLIDVVEMLMDWLASTKRHADGDIQKSIEHNEERFDISSQLSQIFRNTIKELD